jgi:hypothetical protein
MYVEGRVLTSAGEPIVDAVIETWETDEKGEQHFDAFFVYLTVRHLQVSTILNTWTAPYQTAAAG